MPRPRRSYSPEYRVEAAHRVIDSGCPVREIARELDVHENLLHKWVREERRRMAAAGGGGSRGPVPVGGEGLAEQAKDIAFLEKASAYFAARHPK
ncbi:transposase [Nocardia brasiliensis]|uniref:transposase n=1 Tax=Nocardia brasiliensis TaxID=37326 RepID=UPI0024540EA1|nr:transposase [Nocardia brasiliensis]